MNLTPIRPGDVVECSIKGVEFFAKVESKGTNGARGILFVNPRAVNGSRETHRSVTAHQVVGHYRASKATRDARTGVAA